MLHAGKPWETKETWRCLLLYSFYSGCHEWHHLKKQQGMKYDRVQHRDTERLPARPRPLLGFWCWGCFVVVAVVVFVLLFHIEVGAQAEGWADGAIACESVFPDVFLARVKRESISVRSGQQPRGSKVWEGKRTKKRRNFLYNAFWWLGYKKKHSAYFFYVKLFHSCSTWSSKKNA